MIKWLRAVWTPLWRYFEFLLYRGIEAPPAYTVAQMLFDLKALPPTAQAFLSLDQLGVVHIGIGRADNSMVQMACGIQANQELPRGVTTKATKVCDDCMGMPCLDLVRIQERETL